MRYDSVDPAIMAWAIKHVLHVYTRYQDVEVRSVDLVGSRGERSQIWIDPPDERGTIQVHAWDYKTRRQDFTTSISDLPTCLEDAFDTAARWI